MFYLDPVSYVYIYIYSDDMVIYSCALFPSGPVEDPNHPALAASQIDRIESNDWSYLRNGQGIETLKVNGRLAMLFLADPNGEENLFQE